MKFVLILIKVHNCLCNIPNIIDLFDILETVKEQLTFNKMK